MWVAHRRAGSSRRANDRTAEDGRRKPEGRQTDARRRRELREESGRRKKADASEGGRRQEARNGTRQTADLEQRGRTADGGRRTTDDGRQTPKSEARSQKTDGGPRAARGRRSTRTPRGRPTCPAMAAVCVRHMCHAWTLAFWSPSPARRHILLSSSSRQTRTDTLRSVISSSVSSQRGSNRRAPTPRARSRQTTTDHRHPRVRRRVALLARRERGRLPVAERQLLRLSVERKGTSHRMRRSPLRHSESSTPSVVRFFAGVER